jgi:arylsulfatase A-like enzyme
LAEKTFHTYYEPMRAIRTERHKFIVNFEVSTAVDVPSDIRESPIYPLMLRQLDDVRPPVELYDLVEDRWEQHNLADVPELASIQANLRHRLLGWMQETDDPLLHGPVASPYFSDALARLRSTS